MYKYITFLFAIFTLLLWSPAPVSAYDREGYHIECGYVTFKDKSVDKLGTIHYYVWLQTTDVADPQEHRITGPHWNEAKKGKELCVYVKDKDENRVIGLVVIITLIIVVFAVFIFGGLIT